MSPTFFRFTLITIKATNIFSAYSPFLAVLLGIWQVRLRQNPQHTTGTKLLCQRNLQKGQQGASHQSRRRYDTNTSVPKKRITNFIGKEDLKLEMEKQSIIELGMCCFRFWWCAKRWLLQNSMEDGNWRVSLYCLCRCTGILMQGRRWKSLKYGHCICCMSLFGNGTMCEIYLVHGNYRSYCYWRLLSTERFRHTPNDFNIFRAELVRNAWCIWIDIPCIIRICLVDILVLNNRNACRWDFPFDLSVFW